MKRSLSLLTLAPLLGGTDLLIKAIALGLSGLLVLMFCGLLLAPLHRRLPDSSLPLAALLLGATLSSVALLTLQLLSAELAAALELFLPLLILPCLVLALNGRPTTLAGLRPGFFFALFAIVLGSLRELCGHGSLLVHADWLFGPAFSGWRWAAGMPLLTQAAGAFILLGLLLALFRHFTQDNDR